MIQRLEAILIGSADAEKLAKFYREVVGLKMGMVMDMGDKGEQGYEFPLKGVGLYILDHSKVKGKTKDPSRVMFNLEVDDIEKEVARMKRKKVEPAQDIYHVEGYGLIATFADVDGNFFQFVQVKASN